MSAISMTVVAGHGTGDWHLGSYAGTLFTVRPAPNPWMPYL